MALTLSLVFLFSLQICITTDSLFVCYNPQFSYSYSNKINQSAGCSVQYVI